MKKYIKENKILFSMIVLTIISNVGGILFHATLNNENKQVIIENIKNILEKNPESFLDNIINTNIYTSITWILGISIIGIIIVILLYFLKAFIFSFELFSFIETLKLKKILFITLYFLPKALQLILSFFMTYYSISYSICLIRFIFFHKKIDFSKTTKKYLKILGINLILNIGISIINYFIIFPFLKIKF